MNTMYFSSSCRPPLALRVTRVPQSDVSFQTTSLLLLGLISQWEGLRDDRRIVEFDSHWSRDFSVSAPMFVEAADSDL